MFLQSSERVLYYPSIGKSDKIKFVSCSINTDNTKYIFQENEAKKYSTDPHESSNIKQNINKQQLSKTSAHTDYVFLPNALQSEKGKIVQEYLRRLKNKKINCYINLNIPVKKQQKIYQQLSNINHQSRSDLDKQRSQTDRKHQNQYIYERQCYSVQRKSKKKLIQDTPIKITYQLREIRTSSKKNKYSQSKQYYKQTQKKQYRQKNERKERKIDRAFQYNRNKTQTKQKKIQQIRMQRKVKNTQIARTKFLQDQLAIGQQIND